MKLPLVFFVAGGRIEGNNTKVNKLVESCPGRLSDRGSTPLISTKESLSEHATNALVKPFSMLYVITIFFFLLGNMWITTFWISVSMILS